MAANLVVNWETFSKIKKDGFEIYEIEVSEKKASEIESNLFQNQLKYELIAIKKGTEIHSYLVEAYTSLNHTLFANSIENLSNFTGTLNVFQLDGTSVGQLVIFDGHSKNTTEKSVIEPLNEVINFYSYKQSLTNKAPECVEMYTVFTLALVYEHHFSIITVGGISNTQYTHTTVETVKSTSFMNTPYPCGTNGDSYYILYRTTINRDVIDEDNIINKLTGKAKCLNDLLDKNGDSFVKNLLANFKGNSEFDINIVSKDKVTVLDNNGDLKELNGTTTYFENTGSTLVTIEISTSRTDLHAALEGARTILHEYIHADIIRKLNTVNGPNQERLDFKTAYEEYGNAHGTMAQLYLNSMKEALKAFHKNVLTDDYNKYTNYYGETPTDAFYEAMAWSGLKDNNVKAWVDLPAEKKAAIEALANRVPNLSKTVPCISSN